MLPHAKVARGIRGAHRKRQADGGAVAFTDIDATVATLETGALSASGTAQFDGHDWHFTARLTEAGADGAAGLNVTLDGQGKAVGLGATSRDGRGPRHFGRQHHQSRAEPCPAVPGTIRTVSRGRTVDRGGGRVAIDDLALELGGSPAAGAIALRVAPDQRLDIALSAGRLDLDAWLPALLDAGTTVGGMDLPIGIDFSLRLRLGGGTVQRVHATFDF